MQNFTTYSELVSTATPTSSGPVVAAPHSTVYGISIDRASNVAVIAMTPFTSQKLAAAFGAQYGMQLIDFEPAFGRYVFTLPQIKIGPGPQAHEATVYFPPYAATSDMLTFFKTNGLVVQGWVSTDDSQGRVAVVSLPQVKPVLFDTSRGIWRAQVAPNIDPTTIALWAKANNIQLIGYNPATGVLLIQGPKPQTVYRRIVRRTPVVKTTTNTPATTSIYIAFKPGTTFSQAQDAVHQAGGQITSYNSATELAVATIPTSKVTQARASLSASSLVSCVGQSSSACPSAVPSPTDTTQTQPTVTPPATTDGTGTAWTTTDVPPAPSTTTPLTLSAQATDGHVVLTWTAIGGAQSYEVYRSTDTTAGVLIATTTATSMTDVGGTVGTSYQYQIVPVMSSGPDATKAATAGAQWVAATSSPVISSVTPQAGSVSGSVVLSVDARTADGVANVSWSLTSSSGTTTQLGTVQATATTSDPLSSSARMVWDSRGVADGNYTVVVNVADGSAHSTQIASQIRVGNAAPTAPTALGATSTGTQVILTWRQPASANAAAYLVQKDSDIQPVATVATGSLTWTDEDAGPGSHTYTVTLEDQFGNSSTGAVATTVAGSGTSTEGAPTITVRLPNGQQLAPDGAVKDRLILVSNGHGGSGVHFEYAIDGGTWTQAVGTMSCAPECALDWSVASLARGHYTVRVVSSFGVGTGVGITLRSDGTLPAPAAPIALITPVGVSLHWTAAAGELASHYVVSKLQGSAWVVLDEVTGNSYTDRSTQAGSNSYRVQAYNSDGAAGAASSVTTVIVPTIQRTGDPVTTPGGGLGAPQGLRAVAGSGFVTLLWTAVPGASGYVVQRAWQIDGPYNQVGTTGESLFRDTAPIGAVAFYRVIAFAGEQNGPASDPISAAIVPVPQTATGTAFVIATGPSSTASPVGTVTLGANATTASAGSNLQVTASGTASGPVSSVQVQTLVQGSWSPIADLPAYTSGNNSWLAVGGVMTSGLTEGSHAIRAVALSTGGAPLYATATATVTVNHTAPVVTGVTVAIVGDAVQVSWPAVAGSTYSVYRSTGSGFDLAVAGLSGSTFSDAWLPGAQQTGYVVTQTDVYGNESAFSQAVWITTPASWNDAAPSITVLTPNAAERPDQTIVDLAAAIASHNGIVDVSFWFMPLGGSAWSAIQDLNPVNPGAPVSPGGPFVGAIGLTAWTTAFNTSGLAAGKYELKITATDAAGNTAQQFDDFVVGVAGARGPPTDGFALTTIASSTGVQLTWTGAAGDLFQVRRAYGTSSSFISLGTTVLTQFTDGNVLPGATYQYQVVRLNPTTAFTAIKSVTAVSSIDANGRSASSDGGLAVSLQPETSQTLAVTVAQDTNAPTISAGMTAYGPVYDVNATSLASGQPVHHLDQSATLTFPLPAGITQTQAQALSVFHYDDASGTWVREATTLDWANRRLIATVTHFSLFTVATAHCTLVYLCWNDSTSAVISLADPSGVATLVVSDDGGTGYTFSWKTLLLGTIATGPTPPWSVSAPRSSITSLVINAGQNSVEINGNLDVGGVNGTIEVDGTSIKVDTGSMVSAPGAINFNAVYQNNGTTLVGITTTKGGVDGQIDVNGANITGKSVDLEAFAGTFQTTVNGDQTLTGSGDTLVVADNFWFSSSGSITVDGLGTCTYTGTQSTPSIAFTGVAGCTGTAKDKASVKTNLENDGNSKVISHSVLQLIYQATIDIHGASTITATGGDVTMNSVANVTATANSAGSNKGYWLSGTSYSKDDVVQYASKRWQAQMDVSGTTPPDQDSTNWKDISTTDSSVSASQVLVNAHSQLSDTSSIVANSGNVSMTSNLTTNVTTTADSTLSGSGAGIAVAVLTTDSEAFIDSTNTNPISAKGLTISADTNNTAPTTAKASPGGAKGANDSSADTPSAREGGKGTDGFSDSSAKQGDGKSKTSDGTQGLAAALAVTVDVATTKAYIGPSGGTGDSISLSGGAVKIHAGAANNVSATADAGNVKFAPDAPTLTDSTSSGSLTVGNTYYYKVTAIQPGPNATITGGDDVSLGTLNVASTAGFDSKGSFIPGTGSGITPTSGTTCAYTGTTATSFTGVSGCTGTSVASKQVMGFDESAGSPESSHKVPTGKSAITVKWNAITGATGYRIYRGDTAGKETLLTTVGAVTQFDDLGAATGTATPPDSDGESGVGIAVAVNVAVVNTDAYVGGNTTLSATGGVTIEAVTDGPSGYTAHSVSGAGGTSVGVAGSIAVNVVVSNTFAQVQPGPIGVNGDVTMTATSSLLNNATAEAQQSPDPSSTDSKNTSGVGASVAVNVVNDTTSSGLQDSSVLTGAHNLTATSNDSDRMVTVANGGASAGSSGTVAFSAQVAIAISNVTTTASVGTGSPLSISGGLTFSATQNASTTTTSTGVAKGGNAAIGLALGLVVANHIVQSQLNRNLTSSTPGGPVSFTANGASANDTEANASAAGAKGKSGPSAKVSGASQDLSAGSLVVDDSSKFASSGTFDVDGGSGTCSYTGNSSNTFTGIKGCSGTPADGAAVTSANDSTDSSGKDVNGKADDNLKLGNDTSKASDNNKDSGTDSTPKAKSGEGGGTSVTVAAAAAIAIITANAEATLAPATTLSTTGATSFSSSEDVDSKAIGKGSASKAKTADIGAAVAINLVNSRNEASSGAGAVITSNGLSFTASVNKSGPDKGSWTSGTNYAKGNVVTDPTDHNRYVAKSSVTSTSQPHSDLPNWTLISNWVSGHDYAAGDVVTDTDGKQYVSQAAQTNDTTAPSADPLNWVAVTSEPDGKSTLDTESTAGAGDGKVGIAGSLALTIADIETNAELQPTGTGGVTLTGSGANDLTLSATASVSTTTKAMASDKDASTVGIGAGAAIAIITDNTNASIDDGAAVTGAAKVTLSATDTDAMTTYAEAGTAGPSGSTLSLTADAAIALPTVKTTATIAGTGQALTASGAISLSASQTASSSTTAKADAVNGKVVIGLALALNIPDDEVTSTISRTVQGTTVTLTASGSSSSPSEADASATGAKGKGDDASGKDVNGKADDQTKNANQESKDGTGKQSSTKDTSNAQAETSDKNESGSSNTVTVAGAAAINIVTSITQASLADTANVTATTGALTIKTLANTDATATSNGKADSAGTVGIGVGVSVNKVDITNLATTGNATVTSKGLDIESGMLVNGTDRIQRFDGTDWKTIDVGPTFPEQPEDGDMFQLNQGVPGTTTLDESSPTDLNTGTLTVKSTAAFGPTGSTGTLKVDGLDDATCNYTVASATTFTLASATACAGTPEKDVTVTMTTATRVSGDQDLANLPGGNLTVASATDFDLHGGTTGYFSTDGGKTVCSYTGISGSMLTGVSGCTGKVKDGAAVTRISSKPGVYKWDKGSSNWQFQITGIPTGTSFPTSPSTGDYFQLTKAITGPPAFAPGLYQYDGTNWNSIGDGTALPDLKAGEAFPTSPSTGDYFDLTKDITGPPAYSKGVYRYNGTNWIRVSTDAYFRLAEHDISAEAESGAGGDDGKVSIAGALALNLVHDHTEAIVNGGANVCIGSRDLLGVCTPGAGDVTLKALANEEDGAKADSDAKSGKVGIGASAAIQVLNDGSGPNVRAAVEDGATLVGGTNFTVSATYHHDIETEDKAGAGGSIAISPSVSLAIVNDKVVAYVGTGADINVGGAATIKASEEISSSLDSNAKAGGDSVAVGAAVAINVIETNTSADLERNLTAASLTLSASTDASSEAKSEASSSGEKDGGDGGKKADDQTKDQVGNNPNTSGKTDGDLPKGSESTDSANSSASSESGDSGGGVAIAAAVSLNWARHTNHAMIGNGTNTPTVTTTGAVSVSAEEVAGATAKATGLSASTDSTHISAGVGINVENVTNDATVGGGSTVHANGITVEAVNPSDKENDFIVWGFAAAGGESDPSIAGSVSVQVLSYHTEASIADGAHLVSSGDAEVKAANTIGLQNLALAGGGSEGGAAVGGAIVVNVFPDVTTEALIGASTVDVLKALKVTADSSLVEAPAPTVPLITLPKTSSVALAGGASSGGAAVTGSVIVDVLFLNTTASIADGAQVDQHPLLTGTPDSTQTITVTATDTTHMTNLAGTLSLSSSGAGVGIGLVVDVFTKTVSASIGNATVSAAGDIKVTATSTENLTELAVDAAGSSSSAAVDGSIIVVVFNAGDQTVAGASVAGSVHTQGNLDVEASDGITLLALAGGLAISTSAAGVALSAVVAVRDGRVSASVAPSADIQAYGTTGLTVNATQTEDYTLLAIGGAGGDSAAVGGSVVVDVLTDHTTASIGNSATVNCAGGGCTNGSANATQAVVVKASDTTKILALAGAVAVGGTAGVGVGVDVEDIHKTTATTVGTTPGGTSGQAVTVQANGDVVEQAKSSESIKSVSVGGGGGGTAAVSVNAAIPVINVTTTASLGDYSNIRAGGNVIVSADESMELFAVAGNISVAGTAAVGAGIAVPVVTKNTNALIGSHAVVTALAKGPNITHNTVNAGSYSTTGTDIRFDPRAIQGGYPTTPPNPDSNPVPATGLEVDGSTINLGYKHNFVSGQQVVYDAGGGSPITGLTDGGTYWVIPVSDTEIQLSATKSPLTAITGLSLPAGQRMSENQRFVATNSPGVKSDVGKRFTAELDVNYGGGGSYVVLPYDWKSGGSNHPPAIGDPVVYSAGGGTPIGGLVDGATYYVVDNNLDHFQVAKTKCEATLDPTDCKNDHEPVPGSAVPITFTSTGSGRSQSFNPSGVLPAADGSQTGPQTITAPSRSGFGGVAVAASNSDYIASIGIAAGGAGTAAVSLSGSVAVVTVHTTAAVGDYSQINCAVGDSLCAQDDSGASGNQSLLVSAENSFRTLGIAASIAIGGSAGVGASAAVRVIELHDDAFLGAHVVVNTTNNIELHADATDSVISVNAAAGGGTVGVAGTVGVSVIKEFTHAFTGDSDTLRSNNNIGVFATSQSTLILVTASIAAGYVGVGVGVGVAVVSKETKAYVGTNNIITVLALGGGLTHVDNGTVNDNSFATTTLHGLVVQADSQETLFGVVAGVGAGFVGVTANVGVNVFTVGVQAYVDLGTKVNKGIGPDAGTITSGVSSTQGVDVAATDNFYSLTFAGGVAGGFVGASGGIDIGVANINETAYLATGTDIWAKNTVQVNALSIKHVQTYAVSIGGGFVGVAGAVSVWSVGTSPNASYSDDAGGPDRGTWDNTVSYTSGDHVTFNSDSYVARDNNNNKRPDQNP
ncbi:MAG TPA: hypothetical protein VFL29_03300, partial [Candidatus Dormibacteraeota bacterium]|nr:hypothetical protein [Candidatus Dormibacteraeota bacterium]